MNGEVRQPDSERFRIAGCKEQTSHEAGAGRAFGPGVQGFFRQQIDFKRDCRAINSLPTVLFS